MSGNWNQMCRGCEDLRVDGSRIKVTFADERGHRVMVEETDQSYELTAVVVRAGQLEDIGGFPVRAWQRNRATQLVSFRVDDKGRLLGEAWVPKVGVTAEEFQLYVRRLAFECDRYEYLLTGIDRE